MCRTYNSYDINCNAEYFKELFKYIATNNKFKKNAFYSANQKDGRGNLAPVTIILPTLAMEAGQNVEKFMHILDKMIADSRDMLMERFKLMASQSPAAAKYMWENGTMLGYNENEGIISALKHGTLAIGQIGLNETLILLIGKNHTTPEGMELAKRIEGLINKRCAEYKNEYKLNFGVYFTPAENLCKTSFKKFKNKYGDIENVTYIDAYRKDKDGNFIQDTENGGFIKYKKHKEYFTNSMHVPVYEMLNAFDKIDIESQLTNYSNAGCITYVELPASAQHNIDAIETLVNYAMDKDVPYFAMNFPIDNCLDCKYNGEIADDTCPKCGGKRIQRLRRVSGYLTGDYKTAFNSGKIDETEDRNKHYGIEIK